VKKWSVFSVLKIIEAMCFVASIYIMNFIGVTVERFFSSLGHPYSVLLLKDPSFWCQVLNGALIVVIIVAAVFIPLAIVVFNIEWAEKILRRIERK
jgi:hypothetical protein